MLPANSNSSSVSKNTALKSVGEQYLGLKNEINFDREKGMVFINPRLYVQKNNHLSASGLLEKVAQKIDRLIDRYREWRAKEWFVVFVEKNFEKNDETNNLLKSVKNSGRVSSYKFLEVLVEKKYKKLLQKSEVLTDGSLRTRYLINGEKQTIDKLITGDLRGNGFPDGAINAFLDFFHFSETSWNPQSFKDVMNFLNQYSDMSMPHSSVFQLPALQEKIVEMQKAAIDFDANQQHIARKRLRENQAVSFEEKDCAQCSRTDLSDFLEEVWGLSGSENNHDNVNGISKIPLQSAFLRYLRQGTKNMDPIFLENLTNYSKLIKIYPHLFGFPKDKKINNPGLRRIFDQVVDELMQMSAQKKSEKIEVIDIDKDFLNISMRKIFLSFRSSRDILGVFLFPQMTQYINSLDKNMIDDSSRDSFVAVSSVNVDQVSVLVGLSEIEKLHFSRFIQKLKSDLSQTESSLDF